jgi:hypothetical protein
MKITTLQILPRTIFVIVCIIVLTCFGCDVGTNPIILDGTPAEATIVVNSASSIILASYSVNLQDVLSGISKQVDSIKAYNITLQIDDAGGNNPALTGNITLTSGLNSDSVLALNGTSISAFASERSIFDPKLSSFGFTFSSTIISKINQYLQQDPKPTVTVTIRGNASTSPLNFTIHLRLYTQVYTNK